MIDRPAVAAVLVAAAVVLPRNVVREAPVLCPFRRATGLPCPSCGLTRSWQAAADLRVADSLADHPLGAATLLGAVGFALDGDERLSRLGVRRDVRAAAGAIWIATWLWRLRRSPAA